MAAAQGLGVQAYAREVSANRAFAEDAFSPRRVGCRGSLTRITSVPMNQKSRRACTGVRAAGADFGARDPFPAEIASNFADKVQGYSDTEHVILVPNAPAFSLAQRSCVSPLPPGITPFTLEQAKALLRKVVGWRLVEEQSGLKLQCEWRLKDHAAGLDLSSRLSPVSEAEGKPFELHLDDQTHILRVDLWTESIGGLCENDFILAAKIDQVKTSDLIKRTRFWA